MQGPQSECGGQFNTGMDAVVKTSSQALAQNVPRHAWDKKC